MTTTRLWKIAWFLQWDLALKINIIQMQLKIYWNTNCLRWFKFHWVTDWWLNPLWLKIRGSHFSCKLANCPVNCQCMWMKMNENYWKWKLKMKITIKWMPPHKWSWYLSIHFLLCLRACLLRRELQIYYEISPPWTIFKKVLINKHSHKKRMKSMRIQMERLLNIANL